MSSSAGQKVTTDPATTRNPKNENPGTVTSDSLAGESINQGGSFAANSDARGALDQPSHSTTANTTDTSNATKLEPKESQPEDASGLGKESGVGPTYNAASAKVVGSTGGNGTQAPGYASHPAPSQGDNFEPKGKNLTEGGFDSSAPNASFGTDIGGKNDPGRVALQGLEASNVPSAGGAGPRETKISGEGQYDKLDETSA